MSKDAGTTCHESVSKEMSASWMNNYKDPVPHWSNFCNRGGTAPVLAQSASSSVMFESFGEDDPPLRERLVSGQMNLSQAHVQRWGRTAQPLHERLVSGNIRQMNLRQAHIQKVGAGRTAQPIHERLVNGNVLSPLTGSLRKMPPLPKQC